MRLLDRNTRVRDLMHPGVVTCRRQVPLGDVALLLVRHRVHAVFVADDAEPIGVISDTDLLAGEWLGGDEEGIRVMRETRAADIMSAPVESIDGDAPIQDAADRLLRIGRLLVREGERAVGVISVSDVVAAMAARPSRRGSVADVMSRSFVACGAATTVAEVARAMTDRRSRSVVVIDDSGQVVGVVTGHDLIRAAQSAAEAEAQPVSAVMSRSIVSTTADTPLAEAADAMLADEVHRLLVADPGDARRIIGSISTSDVVAEMAHSIDWRT